MHTPEAEDEITEQLVAGLLRDQHPDLAKLELSFFAALGEASNLHAIGSATLGRLAADQ